MYRLFRVITALLLGMISTAAWAENARFIRIFKQETPNTHFHLGELEAFENGVIPDNLGGATWGGMNTSTNDIGNLSLTTYGDGNLYPNIGTTTTLAHGGANKNPNNALESGGAVWTTATNQTTFAQYTLDLGGTFDVTEVRAWPRADTCCGERWQNLHVQLFEDDGSGAPGALAAEQTPVLGGVNVPFSLQFAAEPIDPGGGGGGGGAGGAVPEPASVAIWTILGVAGFGFGLRRMRRKK